MQSCARCGREVYSAEQQVACNKIWHTFCCSCFRCGKLLDRCSINPFEGEIFCKACYKCIRGSCATCNSCAKLYAPCHASCEKLCIPKTLCRGIKNNCCSAPPSVKRCGCCLSDTQCNKPTCKYPPCLDERAPSATTYGCRVSPECRARRCGSFSRCCSRQACSPPRVPREVANYYNRNHDCCDNCSKNSCLQVTHGCLSCESPCATAKCPPPKSCCAPSSACLRAKFNPPANCRPSMNCCLPAECLPSVKCSLPTKCCPPVVKCYQPQKCCQTTKSCLPPDCCSRSKCCTPPKCGSPTRCCSAKSSCPPDPCCSAEPVPPCLSDSCCARGACLGKPVCYPPVKCCEPHPEEIICFHPGILPPKCCSYKTPHPCKCDRETRRTMAIYCNTPCCRRCGHKVYAAEKVQFAGSIFHSCCFTCYGCNKPLDVSNADENQGEIYCRGCYCKYLGIQGYGYGSTLQSRV